MAIFVWVNTAYGLFFGFHYCALPTAIEGCVRAIDSPRQVLGVAIGSRMWSLTHCGFSHGTMDNPT